MRSIKFLCLALLLLGVAGLDTEAQTKGTKKTAAKKTSTVAPLDVRTAREKAVIQHDNVEFWIGKLGPVAEALEMLDTSYAKKKPSASTLATHEERKRKFVETLKNLRGDLAMLESDFRTKSSLQKYRSNLLGITDLASNAEDLAIAGKFVASKQPLRDISKKLTDTLAVMPR